MKSQLQDIEKKLEDLVTKENQYDEYLKTKDHREENPKDENGEDWPELVEPEMNQEEITNERNELTTQKGNIEG